MKIKISSIQRALYLETEEGRIYLEYNRLVGGEPIGLTVPYGYPTGVEEMGGVIEVYKARIERQITWQKLLSWDDSIDDDRII